MTQSFDEFLAERGYIREYKHDYQTAYDYGAQSRQAEIDECKEVAESIEDAYIREKSKVDELRKRIDNALRLVNKDISEFGSSNYLDNAVNVLKGTTNDH